MQSPQRLGLPPPKSSPLIVTHFTRKPPPTPLYRQAGKPHSKITSSVHTISSCIFTSIPIYRRHLQTHFTETLRFHNARRHMQNIYSFDLLIESSFTPPCIFSTLCPSAAFQRCLSLVIGALAPLVSSQLSNGTQFIVDYNESPLFIYSPVEIKCGLICLPTSYVAPLIQKPLFDISPQLATYQEGVNFHHRDSLSSFLLTCAPLYCYNSQPRRKSVPAAVQWQPCQGLAPSSISACLDSGNT